MGGLRTRDRVGPGLLGLILSLGLGLGPAPAQAAGDLGDTLSYVDEAIGEDAVSNYDALIEEHDEAAIAMLVSRDVEKGVALTDYECSESLVDGTSTLRSSPDDKWAARECRLRSWKRSSIPGFQTLGPPSLSRREIRAWVEAASAATDIHETVLYSIIELKSGYRPGLIAEDGHVGIMQLHPDHLAQIGIKHGNLLDPHENIRAGAAYLRQLTLNSKSLMVALAAFQNPYSMDENVLLRDGQIKFFVREVYNLYLAQIKEFPTDIGVEAIEKVWTWLD